MAKSNNEVSREILSYLDEKHPRAVKFVEMVDTLEIDEKVLFKNLFFLEENNLVQLMSSYPAGATYPTIHMVKIKDEGVALTGDEEKLSSMFPLKGFSSRLDLYKINNLTMGDVIQTLTLMVEKDEIVINGDKKQVMGEIKNLISVSTLTRLTLGKIFEHYES
ncbi:MAG: hypothetical protein OEV42_02815 [Deltaproteobacteria bacterium]|nr:hypothetical protein [Deltaproteobacteria bacterium]